MADKATRINIPNKVSASIVDGHQIFINDQTGEASIMFFQILPTPTNEDGVLEAVITNHIRISYGQAKGLCETLQDGLKNFEKSKK